MYAALCRCTLRWAPLYAQFRFHQRAFTHSQVPVPPSDTYAPPQLNALRAAMAGWNTTGFPRAVAFCIVKETNQRTIDHRTFRLKHYQAFSDWVYGDSGELMPLLVARLLSLAQARPCMLLLDLWHSVGKVMLQAVLQCGCSLLGVDNGEARGNGVRATCAGNDARADVKYAHGRCRSRTREHAQKPTRV